MNLSIDQLMMQKLEQLRTKLLDLSLANRLLNFKHSPQGRSYLRIVHDTPSSIWMRLQKQSLVFRALPPIEEEPEDEAQPEFLHAWQTARLSDQVYQKELQVLEQQEESLQRDDKMHVIERALKDRLRHALGWPSRLTLTTSLIEHAKRHGIASSFDLLSTDTHETKSFREDIQLLLLPKMAEQQLSYVRDAAHQRLEETGINMLFCAFGFLQWFETTDSSQPLYAPLLLLPVEIKRTLKQHQFVYTLSAREEEPILNLTLKEKLRQFGFILPHWDEKDSPESYWQRLEEAIQSQKRWKLRRWITVGIFPFSRMAMYEDLDPNQPELIHHPQTRQLLLGLEKNSLHASSNQKEEKKEVSPQLISKVDSSQYAAICKALQCPSLVIKGPPGTGKSQTITNLIAASLARGENVLFIADKQAALNVVFSRLTDAGLAEFCLELHSHQATRTGVIDSLRKRLEIPPSKVLETKDDKLKEIQEIHHALDQYLHFMQQPLGLSQQTIREILWSARHASDQGNFPTSLYHTYFEQIESITPGDIQNAKKLLTGIEKAYHLITENEENLYDHPWRGIAKTALSPFQMEELHELFCQLLPQIEQLESHCHSFAKQHEISIDSLEEAEQFEKYLSYPLGTLEQMDQLWRSLPSPPPSLQRLEQEFAYTQRQVFGLEQLSPLYTQIAQSFGLDSDLPFSAMKSLWLAVQALAHIPFSLLKWRTPQLYSDEARKTLDQAQQKTIHLHSLKQELKKKFRLEQWKEDIDLDVYALILEQSHLLSFLTPSYRRASQFYHAISLQPRQQGAAMAADLRELHQYVTACQQINQDSTLQQLCGPHFKGVDTDFPTLIDAAQFGGEIQQQFAQQDPFHEAIRATLLEGKEEILQQLAALVKHPMAAALNHFLAPLHDQQEGNFPMLLESWKNFHQKLIAIRECAKESQLPPHFKLDDLISWISKEKSFQQTWKNFTLPHKPFQGELKTLVQLLHKQIDAVKLLWEKIQLMGGIEEEFFFTNAQPFVKQSWQALRARIEPCLKYPEKLNHWSLLGESLANAKQEGLDIIFRPYLEEKKALNGLCEAYQMVLSRTLARHAYTLDQGILSRFNGIDQDQALARLATLEREMLQLSKDRLRSLLIDRLPPSGVGYGKKSTYTELALIKHEVSKQKRHIPIRQLMQRAKEAMRILKPCFLMSPLSLAQYLPRDSLNFDLLVIDEASQMRPEEAIGAISRAKRVVIVGDPMQLPPTDFFVKMESSYLDEEEEEETISHESILDLALPTFPDVCDLRWHYRSKHESLIAFSNRYFYDNRLIILPSAHQDTHHLGVKWIHVPGIYQNGFNLIECQTVIKAALKYMVRYPDRSLGIVTLNCTQRDLLREEFEYAIRHSPQAAAYMARWESTLQAPFIKNLENVQGDERDTILISMVYGPNAQGNVAQHFGPINKMYGHRRLNVLFTRARSHLIVFSSLLPDQIKAEGKSPGVGILKSYLEYASTGRLEIGHESDLEPESDFEKCVAEKIRAMGCKAIPQVGIAGYRIDIGVCHPNYPYGYLLGIECDGAAYHSTKEARERDRLRQEILEQLGWTIYRIWSTDWFRDPTTQAKRLQNFIENLLLKKTQNLK